MTPTHVVRLAVSADAEPIARIYNQGIEEHLATFDTEPRTAAQIATRLADKGDHYPTVVVERRASSSHGRATGKTA